jgi:hypothetical protein
MTVRESHRSVAQFAIWYAPVGEAFRLLHSQYEKGRKTGTGYPAPTPYAENVEKNGTENPSPTPCSAGNLPAVSRQATRFGRANTTHLIAISLRSLYNRPAFRRGFYYTRSFYDGTEIHCRDLLSAFKRR